MSSFGGTTTANGPNATSSTSSTKEQAKEKAQEGAQQAKRTVSQQVDQRSTQAGERVGSTAQDIRSVSDALRKQGKDQPAKLAEQAAQRAESLGDYLQRSDGDAILRDIEDFGRQRPWAIIAGGVALGFAASRFLKASSSRRYESSTSATYGRRSLTAGAPTTRTGMAPGDAGYGQTGPGYGQTGPAYGQTGLGTPGRDPLADELGGAPATGAAAPGTGLYTDGERGA
jgi:hypothetical protein